jgi:hypothetical protein
MSTNVRRPCWWVMYLAVPLGAGLFWLEARAPLSVGWHRAAQVGVVLVVFGVVELWRMCNIAALIHEGVRALPPIREREFQASMPPALAASFQWPHGDPLAESPVLHADMAERKN